MPKSNRKVKRSFRSDAVAVASASSSSSFSYASSASAPYAVPPAGRKKKPKSASTNLVAPDTSLGQHFLKNPAVVSGIVAKAAIRSTDVVMEIGPGTGNMTVPLLQRSKNVVAIEYDDRMIREVLKRVEGTTEERKLTVIKGDAIKVKWPFFDVCVANVPYQISSPLVFKLLAHRPTFRCAVMMFQEEFALRLTARPGESLYCRLSVNVQLLAKVDQLMKVGRNNFRPPPKVESRAVRIEPRNPPPPVDFEEWDGMVRLLFNRKNKTLRSALMTKPTIKMLEENVRTHRALDDDDNDNGGDDAVMDEGDENGDIATKKREGKCVSEIIEDVTKTERWGGKRASKLSLDDFLGLLAEFNGRGVHFA